MSIDFYEKSYLVYARGAVSWPVSFEVTSGRFYGVGVCQMRGFANLHRE